MVPAGNAFGVLSRKSHLLCLVYGIFYLAIKFGESIYRGNGKRNEINHIICVKSVTLINFACTTSVLPFRQIGGYNVVIQSVQNYRVLRKSGVTVRKTIDIIIAKFCIMEGLTLLHGDHDFDPMVSYFFLKTPMPL